MDLKEQLKSLSAQDRKELLKQLQQHSTLPEIRQVSV